MAMKHAIVDCEQSPNFLAGCPSREKRKPPQTSFPATIVLSCGGKGGGWGVTISHGTGEGHLLGQAFLPFQGAAEDQSKEFS